MYPYPKDHGNRVAHTWIEEEIIQNIGKIDQYQALRLIQMQKPDFRISILKACVERLPWYRAQSKGIVSRLSDISLLDCG